MTKLAAPLFAVAFAALTTIGCTDDDGETGPIGDAATQQDARTDAAAATDADDTDAPETDGAQADAGTADADDSDGSAGQ